MNASAESARAAHTLLIVDDDDRFRTRLVRAFEERGFEVSGAASFDQTIDLAHRDSPELALVDLRLPGRSGLDVVRALKAIDATTKVVVLTGYDSLATAVESMERGATTDLTKPVDADQIAAAFEESPPDLSAPPPVQTLARVEWEPIQRVLEDCSGNVSQAARLLGIHRRSRQRKLAKRPVPESK